MRPNVYYIIENPISQILFLNCWTNVIKITLGFWLGIMAKLVDSHSEAINKHSQKTELFFW